VWTDIRIYPPKQLRDRLDPVSLYLTAYNDCFAPRLASDCMSVVPANDSIGVKSAG
jgi:hypothetical protein